MRPHLIASRPETQFFPKPTDLFRDVSSPPCIVTQCDFRNPTPRVLVLHSCCSLLIAAARNPFLAPLLVYSMRTHSLFPSSNICSLSPPFCFATFISCVVGFHHIVFDLAFFITFQVCDTLILSFKSEFQFLECSLCDKILATLS